MESSLEKLLLTHGQKDENDLFVELTKLTNGAGFCDTLLTRGEKYIKLELKEARFKRDKKLKPLFKTTQPPYYLRCVKNNAPMIFCLIRVNQDNKRSYVIFKITKAFVLNLDNITFSNLSDNTTSYLTSTKFNDIMEYIKSWV